jgi:hypothetical protein
MEQCVVIGMRSYTTVETANGRGVVSGQTHVEVRAPGDRVPADVGAFRQSTRVCRIRTGDVRTPRPSTSHTFADRDSGANDWSVLPRIGDVYVYQVTHATCCRRGAKTGKFPLAHRQATAAHLAPSNTVQTPTHDVANPTLQALPPIPPLLLTLPSPPKPFASSRRRKSMPRRTSSPSPFHVYYISFPSHLSLKQQLLPSTCYPPRTFYLTLSATSRSAALQKYRRFIRPLTFVHTHTCTRIKMRAASFVCAVQRERERCFRLYVSHTVRVSLYTNFLATFC